MNIREEYLKSYNSVQIIYDKKLEEIIVYKWLLLDKNTY